MRKRNLLKITLAIMCIATIALSGCSNGDDGSKETTKTTDSSETTSSEETTDSTKETETKETNSIIGYWEAKDGDCLYYVFTKNKLEIYSMGIRHKMDIEITEDSIIIEDKHLTLTYKIDNDKLTINEEDEEITFKRITASDYTDALKEYQSTEESEDPGVNGYVVEVGVEMTVVEDDGTIVVYANDGDGTYIKEVIEPEDQSTEDETTDSTEEETEEVPKNILTSTEGRHKAFLNNPILADKVYPMNLADFIEEYGEPSDSSDEYSSWEDINGYRLSVYHDNGVVWNVCAEPIDISVWCDLDTDFSKIDTEKEYTYEEIAALAGSPGTVSEMFSLYNQEYRIVWYSKEYEILYVIFDVETGKTRFISN